MAHRHRTVAERTQSGLAGNHPVLDVSTLMVPPGQRKGGNRPTCGRRNTNQGRTRSESGTEQLRKFSGYLSHPDPVWMDWTFDLAAFRFRAALRLGLGKGEMGATGRAQIALAPSG